MIPTATRKAIYFFIILVVFAVAAFTVAFYFYWQNRDLKNPERAAARETMELVAAIGKVMILPEGETPTVATVTDPEKLRDQVFFANAKAGDKVLLYTNARRAVLYDPVQNKIIEVAPLNIEDSQ